MNFFRKSHCWPDPALSVGELIDTMGALACWELRGPAREKWEVLKQEIAPHLHEFCDEAAKRVAWTLFMIGPCKDSSRPIIVFYSSDAPSRNNVRSSVKASGILERYPGFITMAANKAPAIGKPSILGPDQHPDTHGERNLEHAELHVRLLKDGIAGPAVVSRNQDAQYPSRCTTTIGGIVEWHGRYFLTTAAHVLDQSLEACFADLGDEGELEFDIDEDFPDDSDSDEDLPGITSRGSATRSNSIDSSESSVCSNEWDELDNSDESDGSMTSQAPEVSSFDSILNFRAEEPSCDADIKLLGPFITSAKSADLLLDVALFELPKINFAHTSGKVPAFQTLEVGNISGNFESIDVHVLTRRDLPVKGRLSSTPTQITKCAGSESQELWTVRCGKRLCKGDSGSWVVDVSNERVYGHVVAGNPSNDFVHLVPFINILEFLEKHLGGGWHVVSGHEILYKWLPGPWPG